MYVSNKSMYVIISNMYVYNYKNLTKSKLSFKSRLNEFWCNELSIYRTFCSVL